MERREAWNLMKKSRVTAAVVPVIPEYSFEEAKEAGTVQELYGMTEETIMYGPISSIIF